MIVSVHKKALMCLIRNTPGLGVRSTFFAYSDLDLRFHGFCLRLTDSCPYFLQKRKASDIAKKARTTEENLFILRSLDTERGIQV